jgi:uncharacterized protein YqeY
MFGKETVMSIQERIQEDMKQAMKSRDQERLECLRMVKGALLLKEKETGAESLSDEEVVRVLRSEAKKRRDTAEMLKPLGKLAEAGAAGREASIIEEYLPKQLSEEELEKRVRAYLAEHPEINNPGRLTGALKKELGDEADGRMLAEVCKRVLGAQA